MITIIDYGLGNISAFVNVYKRLSIPVAIAKNPKDLINASKLILPGVGAFDHAMSCFEKSNMREPITNMVFQEQTPLLGVCVGMQMLASSSDEGSLPGLGWIAGEVKKMDSLVSSSDIILPHMGWNEVRSVKPNPLFLGLDASSRFYFLHSYYFECSHKENVLAEAEYGRGFPCSVNHQNIYGVQFHPEKSHHYGARLLKNFADL